MNPLSRMVEPVWSRLRRKLMMLVSNERRIAWLRSDGVRIGKDCLIYTTLFSTEPYLVEIGDRVAISSGTNFITHDASGWIFDDQPDMDVFGDIKVGSHTFFGMDCVVLPGARIGSYCIIGSGSVVRGTIPDGSVVMGNPARVVLRTTMLKQLLIHHRHRLDTRNLPPREKEAIVRRHFGLS